MTDTTRVALTAVLCCLGLWGCPDGPNLCGTDCPPIEGSYALAFEGSPTAAGCADAGVPTIGDAGTLEVSRHGANLTATLNSELTLTGALYETDDFTLASTTTLADGGLAGTSATLSGRYVGPTASTPAKLVGSSSTGRPGCTVSRTFTGTKNP
jgi:hypothetical protein